MEPSIAIAQKLREAEDLLAEEQQAVAQLQVAKALDENQSKADQAKLKAARTRSRDREDEVADLKVALRMALEFEASSAGQAQRDEATAGMLRIEAIGLALRRAATDEDRAGLAYQRAVHRRLGLQAHLQQHARRVVKTVQGSRSDERGSHLLGHLSALADGGSSVALVWRLQQLLEGAGADSMVSFAAGVHFDSKATLTVAGAVSSSLSPLMMRLATVLQAAGFPIPAEGAAETLEHADQIMEALDKMAEKEAA